MTAAGLAFLGLTASQAAASYTAQVQGTTLEVTGNKDSDALTLFLTASATLGLDVGNDGTVDLTFDRTAFDAIHVDGGAGDDEIAVSRAGGAFDDETITLDGGAGDDRLIGSNGPETFDGGSGHDFVDANAGADRAALGAGNDTFQWDPGDGSDTVEGGSGSDALQFNGSNIGEELDVSADGTRVRFSRNVAGIAMDLDTIERIDVRALGGADNLTVADVGRTDLELVHVDESASVGGGDGAKDNVIVNGTSAPDRVTATSPTPGTALISGLATEVQVDNAEFAQDLVTLNGLGGDDTFLSSVDVTGPAAIVANGAEGADTARYLGSHGDDQVFAVANGTGIARVGTATTSGLDVSAGTEETTILALGGDDRVQGANGIATASHFTIDGGDGDDTLGGGDGDDDLIGGQGDDRVDGNRGTDIASLGSGGDRFQWDPGDGSDFVDGQSGFDGLDFNGSNIGELIDVFANGGRARLTRDVAGITMDFDNLEDVAVRALGGTDGVTVGDLRATGVTDVDVSLGASLGGGDGAADTIDIEGSARRDRAEVSTDGTAVMVDGPSVQTHITGSEPALDTLELNTLAGNDEVTVAAGVDDLIRTLVDLGTGE